MLVLSAHSSHCERVNHGCPDTNCSIPRITPYKRAIRTPVDLTDYLHLRWLLHPALCPGQLIDQPLKQLNQSANLSTYPLVQLIHHSSTGYLSKPQSSCMFLGLSQPRINRARQVLGVARIARVAATILHPSNFQCTPSQYVPCVVFDVLQISTTQVEVEFGVIMDHSLALYPPNSSRRRSSLSPNDHVRYGAYHKSVHHLSFPPIALASSQPRATKYSPCRLYPTVWQSTAPKDAKRQQKDRRSSRHPREIRRERASESETWPFPSVHATLHGVSCVRVHGQKYYPLRYSLWRDTLIGSPHGHVLLCSAPAPNPSSEEFFPGLWRSEELWVYPRGL